MSIQVMVEITSQVNDNKLQVRVLNSPTNIDYKMLESKDVRTNVGEPMLIGRIESVKFIDGEIFNLTLDRPFPIMVKSSVLTITGF